MSLGVSLAPSVHWSGVLGSAREGRDEQRCRSRLGAVCFVGVEVPCPGLTPHFLEDMSGCSTELWGDHLVLSPLPQRSPGNIASAQLPAMQVEVSHPTAICLPGSGVGALGTLHCLNPPLCLAQGVQGPRAGSGTHPLLVLAVPGLSCLWERSGLETLTLILAAG